MILAHKPHLSFIYTNTIFGTVEYVPKKRLRYLELLFKNHQRLKGKVEWRLSYRGGLLSPTCCIHSASGTSLLIGGGLLQGFYQSPVRKRPGDWFLWDERTVEPETLPRNNSITRQKIKQAAEESIPGPHTLDTEQAALESISEPIMSLIEQTARDSIRELGLLRLNRHGAGGQGIDSRTESVFNFMCLQYGVRGITSLYLHAVN
jgi:hypothetical protein